MNTPRLTRRRVLQGTAGVAVTALAGCSGGSDGSAGTDAQPGHAETEHGHGEVGDPVDAAEVTVNTTDGGEFHFDPHVTRVAVGGTVTWVLESGRHTATAYHPGNDQPRLVPDGTEAWDSGTLSSTGETYEHTFDTEGVYHYYCAPHEQFGMLGTVIVGEPDPDAQQALQTIPEDKPSEVRGKLQELNEMCRTALTDGHHDETKTDGHHGDEHDEGTRKSDHHDEKTETEDGHHNGTESDDHHTEVNTTADHHHTESQATESGHHDETSAETHHEG